MNKILDGILVSKIIEKNVKERVFKYVKQTNKTPILATIIVGSNPSSVMYVKMKSNACKRVGIDNKIYNLDENITENDLLSLIKKLNKDDKISGILIQHPLPKHINERKCFDEINPDKDVDGVTSYNFGRMSMGENAFISATPMAIIDIFKHYNINLIGKTIVVVGRSSILGKPISMLLLNQDATVTICHSKTENLIDHLKVADIIVAAVGIPKFIQKDWIKKDVIIIDAGYNKGNVGDVDLESCKDIASMYTPVPKGVGPVTISELLKNVIIAAEKKKVL